MMTDNIPPESDGKKTLGIIAYANDQASFYTSKASDIARALSLTAVAVIWFFAGGGLEHISPAETISRIQSNCSLKWALYTAILCIILDLAQYLWGACVWMLARWSLQEALIRDIGKTPSRMSYIIWTISRSIGIPSYLEDVLEVSSSNKESWSTRIDNLRLRIDQYRKDGNLDSAIARTEGIQRLNALVATLFWAKCISVLASFTLLASSIS